MLENVLDKIADLEQNTGLDIFSVLLAAVIIAAIILIFRWAFK